MTFTPLDDDEAKVVMTQLALCDYVGREAEVPCAATGNLAKGVHLLYKRIACAAHSIYVLRVNASHNWAVDGESLVRMMYDASMQLLWMLHEPTLREQRATDYLGFSTVEAHKLRSYLYSSGTDTGDRMACSSKRAEGDRELDAALRLGGTRFLTRAGLKQHKAIGDAYLTDPEAKYRINWYPKESLRSLAEVLGYLEECKLIQKHTSASVHAAAFSLLTRSIITTETALHWALHIAVRTAGAIAEAFGLPMDRQQTEIIETAKQNLYDSPLTVKGR